jgi:hypothetical protein
MYNSHMQIIVYRAASHLERHEKVVAIAHLSQIMNLKGGKLNRQCVKTRLPKRGIKLKNYYRL